MNSFSRRLFFLAFLVAAPFLLGCEKKEEGGGPPPPVEVTVVEAKAYDAPLNSDGIGHVYALRTVSVRPQVTGYIKETYFQEGQDVKDGQPLILIDPAPFQAKLDESVATLRKDRATAAQNKRDWIRYQDLVKQAVISQDDYEQKRTDWKTSEDQVRADEAAVEDASINLGWCHINSPTAGVAGLQQYKTGNLVEANKDIIVTINQIEPINVQLSVAEKDLPDIRKYAAKGPLTVVARYPGKDEVAATGRLTVINNTVDMTTGMITLQAEFDNKNRALWPGQFVDASVVLTKIPNTIMVPSDALLVTQDGVSAFVAKDDGTVEIRPVEVGRKIKNMIVVEKGLTAGEKVVDSAQIKLVPGARIKIVSNEQYKAGPTSPKSGEQGAQGAQETGGSDKKSTDKQGQGS